MSIRERYMHIQHKVVASGRPGPPHVGASQRKINDRYYIYISIYSGCYSLCTSECIAYVLFLFASYLQPLLV